LVTIYQLQFTRPVIVSFLIDKSNAFVIARFLKTLMGSSTNCFTTLGRVRYWILRRIYICNVQQCFCVCHNCGEWIRPFATFYIRYWILRRLYMMPSYINVTHKQGIAGLDCWIAQSELQSNLMDWIVIENPKSK